MSGIESAASMFLRSGGMAVATADTGPWSYAAQHCSSCDLGTAELLSAQGKCWTVEGAEKRFRGNGNGKSAFRANLQPQGQREEVNGDEFLAAAAAMRGLNCGYLVPSHAAENGVGGSGVGQKPAEVDAMKSYTIQDLIKALQMGRSRSKMEAAITVRSLAASSNAHQAAFIAAGGIRPLVELLIYEAGETHWPPEMREKATITVRAEAALALASLSVSNDDNKGAIGAAGAIPLLCSLIQFDEDNYNSALASYESQEMAPFLVLARDAGAGALSCLAKNENNKEAILAAQAVPVLIRMVDRGTSFGRAAAANVLAKLATGSDTQNKSMLGREGAISALIRLLKDGSPKARETAAEALFNLAMCPRNKSKIIQEGGMSALLRMLEGGSQAEKDAASAALKIFRAVGSPPNVRSFGVSRPKHEEGSSAEELELELRAVDGSQHNRDVLKELKEHIQSSPEISSLTQNAVNSNILVLKAFSGISTTMAAMQSELTSSNAPPLTGQPSMQADAAHDFPKASLHMMQSRKKLKVSHADIVTQNRHRSRPFGEGLGRATDHATQKVDPVSVQYVDERGIQNTSCCWERTPIAGHGFQTPPYQDGPQSRSKQPRLAIDGASHPVAGGIFALVNALSSQNPGAQEFAALALMLLATQGGTEVKTAIADAGAIEPLISMVSSSDSPLIRESAAAAIAKLVSGHPGNRSAVVRSGGVKAMVEMAKWSSTLVDGPSGGGSLGARTQAAAIVAVLNISEVLDRHSVGMVVRDAVPCLAQMLESQNMLEIRAGVAGLQILGVSLGIKPEHPFMEMEDGASKFDFVAFEMVSALLDVMRGSSAEAKQSAVEALSGLGSGQCWDSPQSLERPAADLWRRCGIEALLLLLKKGPFTATLTEVVAGTVACVVASPILCHYVHEATVVPELMRLLQNGQTPGTRILAAAAVANLGSRKKRLETISDMDVVVLLRILGGDFDLESTATTAGVDDIASSQPDYQSYLPLQQRSMPYLLLCEHASAILVYAALSGDKKKQVIIDLEGAPILVRVLQDCVSAPENCAHLSILQGGSRPKNPGYRHATQEYAMMGLILLADRSSKTMEKIVRAGGVPTLVNLLGATGGRGKLGASWSEMAAAALLTMAGCEAAREEIIRARGIPSLVQVMKGEGGTSFLSLTGLAAMAQLLGVLALKSQEAKLLMAKAGAVRCLVEILVGGGCLAWAADAECCPLDCPGLLALAQEAAAAALATMVLRCVENAEAAVEAGAVGPLVRMLSVPSLSTRSSSVLKLAPIADVGDSGASSGETGVTHETNKTTEKIGSLQDNERRSMKSLICNDQDNGGEGRTGGSMAAMAALGNMISCFPQCKREVIDAGGLSKLANLLQPKVCAQSNGVDDLATEPERGCCLPGPTKLQESAALVLKLLAENDVEVQETMDTTGVASTAGVKDSVRPNNMDSASEPLLELANHVENVEKDKDAPLVCILDACNTKGVSTT